MEDQDFIDSQMDGKPYKAARHAATLRRHLWREHLGLLPAQEYNASEEDNARSPEVCLNADESGPEDEFVMDPLGDGVWDTWTSQASVNTETYRMLFRADPDDHIKTFDDYDAFVPRGARQGHLFDPYMPAAEVREKLDRIKGHLVWMPLDFLCDAEMAEPGLAVNQITEVSNDPILVPDTQYSLPKYPILEYPYSVGTVVFITAVLLCGVEIVDLLTTRQSIYT